MILTSADVMANSAIAAAKHRVDKQMKAAQTSSKTSDEKDIKRQLVPSEDLPGLDILGPKGTDAFIHSLRHFMRREAFRLRVYTEEYNQPPSTKKPTKRQKCSKSGQGFEQEDFHVQMLACEIGSGRYAHSYIFTTPQIQGKFLVQKAMELGIPKGPLYSELKNGNAVTFINPKTGTECRVESSEVVEQGIPGVSVLILYYPTFQVLNQLRTSNPLVRLLSDQDTTSTENAKVDLIIHTTNQNCFESSECSEWRRGMNLEIEHVFLDTGLPTPEMDPGTPFHSTAAGANCRSTLLNDLFVAPAVVSEKSDSVRVDTPFVRGATPLLEYTLTPRPKKGFVNIQYHSQHRKITNERMMNSLLTSGAINLARELLPDPIWSSADGAHVLFTGTGSAVPCKHRNVSGIYLQMTNQNGILLDVGEGTVGQLARAKQSNALEEILRRLRAVWISHPHADHHLGILRLLTDRTQFLGASDRPLILIAPSQLRDFLVEYENVDPLIAGSYDFVDCKTISKRSPERNDDKTEHEVLQRLKDELGITDIHSTPVQHCAHSYAITLRGTSFGTVAYSGDCRPSRNFAEDAQNADLLIHEATFTDGMEAEAALKRHCTVGEALSIAERMNAKSVILTHFSQRFPKIPPISRCITQEPRREFPVIFAFDYMQVTPQNLIAASKITPALRLLYPEESTIEDPDDVYTEATEHDAGVLGTPGIFAQKELL